MNMTRLKLIGLTLLILSGLQATPAQAGLFERIFSGIADVGDTLAGGKHPPPPKQAEWQRVDVACGNGLKLQRASGIPGGAVHTYVFGGECTLASDYDTGPWTEGRPPLSATARWDKASGTYTETLHLLAPRKFSVAMDRGNDVKFTTGKDYHVGTGREEATFKCDADPVINRTSHCTLITQHNGTGWGGADASGYGSQRNDGFAWKASQNQPLLIGRATAAQAASLSGHTARIDCRGLRLIDATGVPNGRKRSYRFDGTCRLYHTRNGSQGLQVTQVLLSGYWEGQQAKEGVMVLTDGMKGGGSWSTTYTCNEDPWLNRNAQCSKAVRLGGRGKAAPVYDPITDLMDRHPVALGMANARQATKLSGAHHGSRSRHAAKQPVTPPRIFKSIGHKGMVFSGLSHPSPAKPKLTIQNALASITNDCDANKLLQMNVVIRNTGGPLLAHTRFAYVRAIEPGGAHLITPHLSLPAISTRETWRGVLMVGTRKSLFSKLPGRHTLLVSIGPGNVAPGTLPYIPTPSFRVSVYIPTGYCQQLRRSSVRLLMRGATTGAGKPAVGLQHGMQQRGVRMKLTPQKKLAPVRQMNLPVQLKTRKKLAPAAPVRRLNLPTQLMLNR